MLLITINKPTNYSRIVLKESSIIQVAYGISKNMLTCAILLIKLYKKVYTLLRHGLLLEIASLFKKNMNKL